MVDITLIMIGIGIIGPAFGVVGSLLTKKITVFGVSVPVTVLIEGILWFWFIFD